MCTRGTPCPPLQGTVQAPGTGGCIWEGSRRQGRLTAPRGSAPAHGSADHPRAGWEPARLGSGHCSGQALPPCRRGSESGSKQSWNFSELPCPFPSPGPLPGLIEPSTQKLSLTVQAVLSSLGQGRAAPQAQSPASTCPTASQEPHPDWESQREGPRSVSGAANDAARDLSFPCGSALNPALNKCAAWKKGRCSSSLWLVPQAPRRPKLESAGLTDLRHRT